MKRTFSLLEVVIAMTLTAVLLTGLFASYRHLSLVHLELEKVREERHWTYVTHLRLMQVFEQLGPETLVSLKEDSLTFHSFENKFDPDPDFCRKLDAKLSFFDGGFALTFEVDGKHRTEIFKKGVESFSIQLFDPKENEWVDELKRGPLPPLLKLTLDEETLYFSFPRIFQVARYA